MAQKPIFNASRKISPALREWIDSCIEPLSAIWGTPAEEDEQQILAARTKVCLNMAETATTVVQLRVLREHVRCLGLSAAEASTYQEARLRREIYLRDERGVSGRLEMAGGTLYVKNGEYFNPEQIAWAVGAKR